jgi:hypothetical protein
MKKNYNLEVSHNQWYSDKEGKICIVSPVSRVILVNARNTVNRKLYESRVRLINMLKNKDDTNFEILDLANMTKDLVYKLAQPVPPITFVGYKGRRGFWRDASEEFIYYVSGMWSEVRNTNNFSSTTAVRPMYSGIVPIDPEFRTVRLYDEMLNDEVFWDDIYCTFVAYGKEIGWSGVKRLFKTMEIDITKTCGSTFSVIHDKVIYKDCRCIKYRPSGVEGCDNIKMCICGHDHVRNNWYDDLYIVKDVRELTQVMDTFVSVLREMNLYIGKVRRRVRKRREDYMDVYMYDGAGPRLVKPDLMLMATISIMLNNFQYAESLLSKWMAREEAVRWLANSPFFGIRSRKDNWTPERKTLWLKWMHSKRIDLYSFNESFISGVRGKMKGDGSPGATYYGPLDAYDQHSKFLTVITMDKLLQRSKLAESMGVMKIWSSIREALLKFYNMQIHVSVHNRHTLTLHPLHLTGVLNSVKNRKDESVFYNRRLINFKDHPLWKDYEINMPRPDKFAKVKTAFMPMPTDEVLYNCEYQQEGKFIKYERQQRETLPT